MTTTELPTPVVFEIAFVNEIKSAPAVAERLLKKTSAALTTKEIDEKLAKAEEKRQARLSKAVQLKESRKNRRENGQQ